MTTKKLDQKKRLKHEIVSHKTIKKIKSVLGAAPMRDSYRSGVIKWKWYIDTKQELRMLVDGGLGRYIEPTNTYYGRSQSALCKQLVIYKLKTKETK